MAVARHRQVDNAGAMQLQRALLTRRACHIFRYI